MAKHYLYILRCADNTLYTGYTTDPKRRIFEHNSGKGAKYTRSRRPVKIAYLVSMNSKAAALRREIEIKSMSRRAKLQLCQQYAGERRVHSHV